MATPRPHIPYELRQLIWEYTLPPRRIFHVDSTPRVRRTERLSPETKRVYRAWFGPNALPEESSDETTREFSCFKFKNHHPPPVITRVCRESRECAIRAGCFLLPTLDGDDEDHISAAWFNDSSDLLYYPSQGAAANLDHIDGLPNFAIANLARMRSVAVGWWYFSTPSTDPFVPNHPVDVLKDRLLAIYGNMPAINTLYIIHPDFRDRSRTRQETLDSDPELVRVQDPTIVFYNEEFKPWGHVVQDFYDLIGTDMVQRWQRTFGDDVFFPPEMVGYLLSGSTTDSVGAETLTSD